MTSNRPISGEDVRDGHVEKAAVANELKKLLVQRFRDSRGDVGKRDCRLWAGANSLIKILSSEIFERTALE
jgi:hypothetical protein